MIKIVSQWIRLHKSSSLLHLQNHFHQYTQLLYKFFAGATQAGGSMGGCKFGNILPISVQKMLQKEKLHVLLQKVPNRQSFLIWKLVSTILLRILWKPWTPAHSRETQSHRIFYCSQSASKTAKRSKSPRRWGIVSCSS